jgi:O-antigen/teichoic acid export membrane protein
MNIKEIYNFSLGITGKDGAWFLLGKIILLGNAFLISVFLVKKFGLNAVGTYTIANVAITFLSIFCGLGLNYSLPREQLSNQERNTITLVLEVLLIPVTAIIIGIYSWIMASSNQELWEIAFFSSGGFFFALVNQINTLFILQDRTHLTLIFPLIYSVGVISGMLFSSTILEFALVLLIFRGLGSAIPFFFKEYARVSMGMILNCAKGGFGYIPTDLISTLSDQSGPLIMSHIMSRVDLGIFGLCRQVLTAADIPGWSFIQSKYPKIVKRDPVLIQEIGKQNGRIALLTSLVMNLGSLIMGFFIFKVPHFWYMMCVLMLTVPFRYNNNFSDQIIKAYGFVRLNTYLALLQFLLAIPIFFIFPKFLGLWGGVLGLAFFSLLSDLLYRNPAKRLYLGKLKLYPA